MMKRLLVFSVVFSVVVSCFLKAEITVKAEGLYPLACPAFEVSYIKDDGTLEKVDCYDDFASAKSKMQELGGDHVVRHANSWSPTKIIAMNEGLAYSYPSRNGIKGLTMSLFESKTKKTDNYITTYITNHYEMTYLDTVEIIAGGTGMIKVVMNGFEGYTDLEYTDLVPMKYLRNAIPIYLGGKLDGPSVTDNETPYSVICRQNYYEVVENDGYRDLVFHYYRAYSNKEDLSPVAAKVVIGQAPDFMKTGVRYYSNDGINFYIDDSLKSEAGKFYNYYQFLPLRSVTAYTAEQLDSYLTYKGKANGSALKAQGASFIEGQDLYGANALLLYAMAIHESGFGLSALALNYNNLFGWGAYDANVSLAKRYDTVKDCILAQMGDNLANYMDYSYKYFFGPFLGNKGSGFNVKYASDPYWGLKIAGIAYDIDKYLSGSNGALKEYGHYEYAEIVTFDAGQYLDDNGQQLLFTSKYSPNYQKNHMAIILEKGENYTKIQCSNPIVDGNVVTPHTIYSYADYDFANSVVYIKTADLAIKTAVEVEPVEPVEPENTQDMLLLDSIEFKEEGIALKGIAFETLHNYTEGKVKHYLELVDENGVLVKKRIEAKTTQVTPWQLNDNYTYEYIGFEVLIPYAELLNGDYSFNVIVLINDHEHSLQIRSTADRFAQMSENISGRSFVFKTNELYDYVLYLRVSAEDKALVASNLPSSRLSMVSRDSLTLDEDNKLAIKGQAMIYYLNYSDSNAAEYTLYLLNDEQLFSFAGECLKTRDSIKQLIGSSYNIDYIDFVVEADLSALPSGNYQMYLEIKNGNSVDYVEFYNYSHKEMPEQAHVAIKTSNVRDRLYLEVK